MPSSVLRCSLFAPMYAAMVLALLSGSSVRAGNFDHLFPNGIIPLTCSGDLDKAGVCVAARSCHKKCFQPTSGPNTTAAYVNAALELFYIPVEAQSCADFEDPICPFTTCCTSCQREFKSLYRCIITDTNGTQALFPFLKCSLNCTGSNSVDTSNSTLPANNTGESIVVVADGDAASNSSLPINSTDVNILGNGTNTTNTTNTSATSRNSFVIDDGY
mmetsp:Transcript_28463/g.53516  ORF Transcript_28463/g.53516 Transcript_28463/m.53516 type:complete len:217 (+) Transcript_28463:190-840(+)